MRPAFKKPVRRNTRACAGFHPHSNFRRSSQTRVVTTMALPITGLSRASHRGDSAIAPHTKTPQAIKNPAKSLLLLLFFTTPYSHLTSLRLHLLAFVRGLVVGEQQCSAAWEKLGVHAALIAKSAMMSLRLVLFFSMASVVGKSGFREPCSGENRCRSTESTHQPQRWKLSSAFRGVSFIVLFCLVSKPHLLCDGCHTPDEIYQAYGEHDRRIDRKLLG